MNSIANESHHMPTIILTLFVVSKYEWDKKEGTGKSMKNVLYIQQYGKQVDVMSNNKPITLAIAV